MVGQNAIWQVPLEKLLCLQRMHCKILFRHKYLKTCGVINTYCLGIGKVSLILAKKKEKIPKKICITVEKSLDQFWTVTEKTSPDSYKSQTYVTKF